MSAVRSSREAVNVIGESLEMRRTVEAVSGAPEEESPVLVSSGRCHNRDRRTVFKDCGIRAQH